MCDEGTLQLVAEMLAKNFLPYCHVWKQEASSPEICSEQDNIFA